MQLLVQQCFLQSFQTCWGVACYTVDAKYYKEKKYCDQPVYPFEDIHNCLDVDKTEFVLGLGYSSMNQICERKYMECKERGFNVHTFVSPFAIVYTENIGEGSIIMPGAYIGPYSKIGIGNVIRAHCTLSHHDTIGNFNWIADGCTLGGGVIVDDNCFIGLGSTIRNEVTIAEKTFVGAHSYVSNNTPPDSVIFGVPGKLKNNVTSLGI